MRIQLLKVSSGEKVSASIVDGRAFQLPSIQEGWRFNFQKHARAKGAHVYVIVTDETPRQIEGCLIYKMKNDHEPYMAYLEIAPHNSIDPKRFDQVAGCLIAYACRLSFQFGNGDFKGWLAFDVQENTLTNQKKLMQHYSLKYKAVRVGNTTTMVIKPEDGEALIETYLNK